MDSTYLRQLNDFFAINIHQYHIPDPDSQDIYTENLIALYEHMSLNQGIDDNGESQHNRELAMFSIRCEEYYEKYGPDEIIYSTIPQVEVINSEVGDDHIQLTDSPMTFISELITAEDLFSIKISEKDTFISSRCGNYSENFMLVPDSRSEVFRSENTINDQNTDSNFLDVAKIRTILPVVSMRQKHSDTLDGKVSLLGKSAMYDTSLCGPSIRLSMCFQKICLNLDKEIKFPYLPAYLGGLGSPPIFESLSCVIRSFQTYKGGTYERLLCYILMNMEKLFDQRDKDAKVVLGELRSKTEYWHNWYKVQSRFVPEVKGNVDSKYDQYIVGQYGNNEIWDNAARRMLSAGVFITDDELLIVETTEAFNKLLLSPSTLNAKQLRIVLEGVREYMKQKARVFSNKTLKQKEFSLYDVQEITARSVSLYLSIYKGRNEILRNIIKANVLYWRAAKDVCKQTGPLSVNIQVYLGDYRLPVEKEHLVIYDKDTVELINWFKNLETIHDNDPSTIAKAEILEIPRELIKDDEVIFEVYKDFTSDGHQSKAALIVTADSALCRRINDIMYLPVFMVHPSRNEDAIIKIKQSLIRTYPDLTIKVEIDTGSRKAYKESLLSIRVRNLKRLFLKPFINSDRRRREQNTTVIERVPKADATFDKYGFLSHRENRRHFRKEISLKTNAFDYIADDSSE